MKTHRFDPLSFVFGLSAAIFGAILLWGNVQIADLRPSHLWPFPVLALGMLFSLYGVRRLIETARAARTDSQEEAQPEISSIQD